MKPISLRIKGAIGIRDGLGIDEIEIDFSRFSPGLIAIVGNNGSGKTTVLDNMHPFLELPSRPGTLANHFYLRDSHRDFVFEINGQVYRSHILIDAHTGKTEAYLYRDGVPLNDGKIATYKVSVEHVLGTPELFFQSIFSAQGVAGFTSLIPSKRKELFFEILGLQLYEAYVEYARTERETLEKDLAAKKALTVQIDEELQHSESLQMTIKHTECGLKALQSEIDKAQQSLQKHEIELMELQRLADAARRQKIEVDELHEELKKLDLRRRAVQSTFANAVDKIERRRRLLEKEIARASDILAHEEEIRSKVEELHSLKTEEERHSRLESELHQIERKESEYKLKLQQQWNSYNQALARLELEESNVLAEQRQRKQLIELELAAATKHVEDLRVGAQLVEQVPCFELDGLSDRCRLLKQAVLARATFPSVEEKVKQLKSLASNSDNDSDGLSENLKIIKAKKAKLDSTKPDIHNAQEFQRLKENIGYDPQAHREVTKRISVLVSKKWEELIHEVVLVFCFINNFIMF